MVQDNAIYIVPASLQEANDYLQGFRCPLPVGIHRVGTDPSRSAQGGVRPVRRQRLFGGAHPPVPAHARL